MSATAKNKLGTFAGIIAGFAFLVTFFSSVGAVNPDIWLYSTAFGLFCLASIPVLLGKKGLQRHH